jgi:hypothetical protein
MEEQSSPEEILWKLPSPQRVSISTSFHARSAGKQEIQITNIVASASLNGVVDLDKLYSSEGMVRQHPLRAGAVSGPDLPMEEPTRFSSFSLRASSSVQVQRRKRISTRPWKIFDGDEENEVLIRG